MAFKGRISFANLPNERPTHDRQRFPLTEFLLSPAEVLVLEQHYSILLLRVLCSNISFLKPFRKFVPNHILHEYSVEMNQKSEERSLGLIFENENTTDGMATILESLHGYVPDGVAKVVFGGDQLTCERATGVQRLRQTGRTKSERLDGFLPTAESWHAKMCLMTVSRMFIIQCI